MAVRVSVVVMILHLPYLVECSTTTIIRERCQTLNYFRYTVAVETSGTRWLSVEEQETWRAFIGTCHAFFAAIDAQLQRDTGIPLAYYEILVRLSEAPGHTLRMSQLADAAASSKSRISHAVARLEERGWIRRRDCPTDRRGQLAELTDEGYAVLVAAAPGHVEQVRRILFDPLTPEQVRQLRAITGSILAAVGNPPPCEDGDGCPGTPAPPLTSGRPAGR
jgi:DNA-binding MarR family transcriptional regulator